MKDFTKKIEIDGKEYELIFNLNVMQEIQAKYESVEKWGELVDTNGKEPNVEALLFGLTEMMNEAVDIANETKETPEKMFTPKQVGRLVSKMGIGNSATAIQETIIEATKSDSSKNA